MDEPDFVDTFFDLMAEIECGTEFDSSKQSHIDWVRNRIATHYLRGTKFFALYAEDTTPIGFAAVLVDDCLEGVSYLGRRSELLDIALRPAYRGKGHGSELLRHAEDYSKQQGAYCMYMSTYGGSYDVIAFYGKNGYVPVAYMPDVYGPGNDGRVCMRKILE
jgi:ribosomal protein S18 acetylase RimI-like enzyme